VLAPAVLSHFATTVHGPLGLGLATVLRVLLGLSLFVAAPRSRAPLAFRALGAVMFAVGCLTPLIGVARFDSLLAWWAALPPLVARTWSACALAMGSLIAYGIIPRDAR
jgi:preprotein translocase subunit SecY